MCGSQIGANKKEVVLDTLYSLIYTALVHLFTQVRVASDWQGRGKTWMVKAVTLLKAKLQHNIRRSPPTHEPAR